jgi:hypothetical protein
MRQSRMTYYVEDVTIGIAHEEAAHPPWLVGKRM